MKTGPVGQIVGLLCLGCGTFVVLIKLFDRLGASWQELQDSLWLLALACLAVMFLAWLCLLLPNMKANPDAKPRPAKSFKKKRSTPRYPHPQQQPQAALEARRALDDFLEYYKVCNLLPYHSKYLMTRPEKAFFNILADIAKDNNLILVVKPTLKEFIAVEDYDASNVQKRAWREISQKHVDFLFCKPNGFPYFAIEYDGDTHNPNNPANEATIRSDAFKLRVFGKINLPLIRFKYSEWTYAQVEETLSKEGVI